MRASTCRCSGDQGQVGGIEVLPLGVLVFVVGALLLANAWAVVDARLAATTAAREATRSAVEASDGSSALEAAVRAGREALAGMGRDPSRLEIALSADRPFGRCARVTATASTWVPAITLPWIGGFGRRFEIEATATEVVDPLREGLSGDASCIG